MAITLGRFTQSLASRIGNLVFMNCEFECEFESESNNILSALGTGSVLFVELHYAALENRRSASLNQRKCKYACTMYW